MDEERESHLNLKEPFAPSEDLKVGLLTRKTKGGYIGNFEDIPEQEKDNEYLQTGYRIVSGMKAGQKLSTPFSCGIMRQLMFGLISSEQLHFWQQPF